jgi:DNA processing protein
VSELALAAFAAETGSHVVCTPRDRAFRVFVRGFDEVAYLARLRDQGTQWIPRSAPEFPPLLHAIHDPPPGLFVRGEAGVESLRGATVAVVGARSCSPYGAQVARMLGRELGRAGLVVVSGLARGVDGEAHRGALESSGVTVGVLGCGIDRDYPAAHRELATRIRATGLTVSEYAPGVEPAPWRFPARNRIIAGLSAATVVVEARDRSGALITADLALEEGREVFAVPGEITSALSAGTNDLLKLGATPLTGSADVLDVFGWTSAESEAVELGSSAEAVLARLRDGPASADELARATGLDAGALASALTELELAGCAVAGGGVYRAN